MPPRSFVQLLPIAKKIKRETKRNDFTFRWPETTTDEFLAVYGLSQEEYNILASHLRPRPGEFDPSQRQPFISVDSTSTGQSPSPKKRKVTADDGLKPIPFHVPTKKVPTDTSANLQTQLAQMKSEMLPHLRRSAFHLGVRLPNKNESADQYYDKLLTAATNASDQLNKEVDVIRKRSKKGAHMQYYEKIVQQPGHEQFKNCDFYILGMLHKDTQHRNSSSS